MKLLQELARRVKDVGPLRKAWFTTFNLNFDLLETYILPVLVGCDVPRTAAQYEALQVLLATGAVDVRVFCDTRTVQTSARKRTSVPIHRIDFRSAGLEGQETRFAKGFFHPKVIYLEGENGAVIGAGSANLSTDGWGKNRECFHFEAIRDVENLNEIEGFFRRIHEWGRGKGSMPPLQVAGVNQTNAEVNWSFVSSFSSQTFLQQLLGAKGFQNQNLTVWSPYFAKDLGALVKSIEGSYALGKLRLVPDLKDWTLQGGGRMRISQESVQALVENHSEVCRDLSFLKANPNKPRFSHAKVWHTPNRIGIGSWNFTGPALGLGTKANVEAGIVIRHKVGANALEVIPEPSDCAMRPEELDMESLDLIALKSPVVVIRVVFDWKELSWEWDCIPPGASIQQVQLRLPKMVVELSEQCEGQVKAFLGFRLVERHVSVDFLQDGKAASELVWVEERNAQERPRGGFETLDGLFVELLQSDPGKALEGDRFVFAGEAEDGTEEFEESTTPITTATNISYFRMFAGMRQVRMRFDAGSDLDADLLRRRVRVEPGCLVELYEKILGHCKVEEDQRAGASRVVRWFWYQELRLVLEAAQGAVHRLEQQDLLPDLQVMTRGVAKLAQVLEPEPNLLAKIRLAMETMK